MIAVYVRVSSREQLEGYGIDVQKTQVYNHLKEQGVDLTQIKLFEDPGYSASSVKRPALQSLLDEVEQGNITEIYVYKLDRMFRNLHHQLVLLDKFALLNVRLICITEQIDYLSANGKLFTNIRGSVFQWERDSVSERTRDGLYQSALEGNYAKPTVPFGYQRVGKKIVPLEIEATTVRRVFDLLEETQGPHETSVAAKLEFPDYANKLQCHHIISMVRNKIYIGVLVLRGAEFADHSPAIIDTDQFNRVQEFIDESRYTKHSYFFRNLIYTSDSKKFEVTSGTSRTGVPYYYYKSKNKILSEKKLFELLIKIYRTEYPNFDIQKQDRKRKNSLNRKKDIVIQLFVQGLISKENYVKTLQEINDEIGASLAIINPEFSGVETDRGKAKFVKNILEKVVYSPTNNKLKFKFKNGLEVVEEYK